MRWSRRPKRCCLRGVSWAEVVEFVLNAVCFVSGGDFVSCDDGMCHLGLDDVDGRFCALGRLGEVTGGGRW